MPALIPDLKMGVPLEVNRQVCCLMESQSQMSMYRFMQILKIASNSIFVILFSSRNAYLYYIARSKLKILFIVS